MLSLRSALPVARLSQQARKIFSQSGKWDSSLTREGRLEIENHWKSRLKKFDSERKKALGEKYYVLSMFPYPSGKLHMGHVRVYTISDVMARYHRLMGRSVIHPMGWDAFGLPAENAAIERNIHPDEWTHSNIANMKSQLEELACSFDWDREFATCSPEYYKWTQALFLMLHEAGLVYQREGAVNWDPVDQTVLADEQIDLNGCSWRSGAKAEKRFLKQWYIRVSPYVESLLKGLDEVDPALWRHIIDLQKAWIGSINGARMEFTIKHNDTDLSSPLSLFTKTPECIFGASHILVSNEHWLNNPQYYKDGDRSSNDQETELNVCAINPFTQAELPIFISHSYEFKDHLGCHIGMPSSSEEDRSFAQSHNLKYTEVLNGKTLQNSGILDGQDRTAATEALLKLAKELGCVCHMTSQKSHDWLVSRQRYWGTPIPMVHCPKYGTMPVPYEDLPVTLPKLDEYKGKGISPLEGAGDWLKVKCSKCDCDGYARRETDTMDTFFDSSWYFLRYLDPQNRDAIFDKEKAHEGMPVDLYIGGREHAIMHLYYARFINHFLHNCGLVPKLEPFVNLLTQGMVMGKSFKVRKTGKYLRPDEVDFSQSSPVEAATGEKLFVQWEKMSKSKYNGTDPQEMLDTYGTDSTRLCILANVAPKSDRHWSLDVFLGIERWQGRIWSLIHHFLEARKRLSPSENNKLSQTDQDTINDFRNYYIKEVSFHLRETFLLNTAIASLQAFTADLRRNTSNHYLQSAEFERALLDLVIMLSPFAPMFCCELWSGLTSGPLLNKHYKEDLNVLEQSWPIVDADYRPSLKAKVTQRTVLSVKLPYTLSELSKLTKEEAFELVKAHPSFKIIEKTAKTDLRTVSLEMVPNVRAELLFVKKESQSGRKKDAGSDDDDE